MPTIPNCLPGKSSKTKKIKRLQSNSFFDSAFDMKPFVHLRTYSDYSLLLATNKPKALVDLAVKNDVPAIALTDKNNLHGALEFAEYAKSCGIQPIAGLDLGVRYGNICSDVLLIAKTEFGYKNLIKLSGLSFKKKVDLEDVLNNKKDLILLSGNIIKDAIKAKSTAYSSLTEKLLQNFDRDFFIEIDRAYQDQFLENQLLELAHNKGIPIVATNSVLFAEKAFAESHDVLSCIGQVAYISTQDRKKYPKECYFKTPAEMQKTFSDLKEATENTALIAQRCTFMPQVRQPTLPKFPCQTTEDQELRQKATLGLQKKFEKSVPQQYLKRLEYELDVIIKMQYPGYFLIVSDFINWSKKNDIPVGPGRGSGVGSVVAWALGITGLDPLKFGLLFERFLNPVRVSMPDFDIDFCQEKRQKVIDYVQKKYGHVAQIVTFGSLQPRAALRDVGRVLQFSYNRVDGICKMIPNNPANPISLQQAIDLDKNLQEERDKDESIKKLLDISLKLEGVLRHSSTHAAGIVICDHPIEDCVPVYYEEDSDIPITQYSMKYIEKAGLVKFDFLGLKTLTMINNACKLIKINHPDFDIEKIELDDKKTFELLSLGKSIGVFQLENAFMCEVLKKLKPDSIDDIIALVSLNRPGPMANIPTYIARKHGKEKIEYPHPLLQKALSETFGVTIYQEQVMEIAKLIAGYTLAEADILRRAMGKKIRSEMAQQNQKFVNGAVQNNIDKDKAQEIFDMVEKFAGYGFNKSHAAAYAYISYQTAFLKANFPLEFFVALLNLEINNTDKLAPLVQEAKNCEIKILPPDVNSSFANFKIEENKIRYALSALKNVGGAQAELLEKEDAFESLEDFASRTDFKIVNKRALEGLIKSGALDKLEPNRAALFGSVENIMASSSKNTKQMMLFDIKEEKIIKDKIKNWNFFEKTQKEFESIGLFLQNHPVNVYKNAIKLPTDKMTGVITQVRIRSRAERKFAVLQLATTEDMHTVICYESQIIEAKQELFAVGQQVILDVLKSDNGIVCKNIYSLKNFILKNMQGKMLVVVNNQDQVLLLKNVLKSDGKFEITAAIKLKNSNKYKQVLLGQNFSFDIEELVLIDGIKIAKSHNVF